MNPKKNKKQKTPWKIILTGPLWRRYGSGQVTAQPNRFHALRGAHPAWKPCSVRRELSGGGGEGKEEVESKNVQGFVVSITNNQW